MSPPPSRLEAHIRRTLELRYPRHVVTNDTLGLDRLRALLDTIAIQGNSRKLRNIMIGWAPFLGEEACDRLFDQCMNARRKWSSVELGTLFDLTEHERSAIGAWNIRPAGYTDDDMKRLRRETKARSSCRIRRRKAKEAHAKSKAAADDISLTERQKSIYMQTADAWRSTTEIGAALASWPEYKPLARDALRKAVLRACNELIGQGWLSGEVRSGSRRQTILFVRRTR
jgi:hypothetical protein